MFNVKATDVHALAREILLERDRYREALEEIVRRYELGGPIIPLTKSNVYDIAKKALAEGQEKP